MNYKIQIILSFILINVMCYAQEKPNILVIITDQHSGSILTQRGYEHISTPGIDKLAEQGVTFTRSYCTYPVCTASRKSFMTGMMPSKATPTNYPSVAGLLTDGGYETAYLGKWHVGSTDIDDVSDWHGFQTYRDGHDDTDITGWSTDFLKQEHSKPFFLITSFLNPHDCCELARNIAGDSDSYHDGAVEEQMDTAYCPMLPSNFAIPENEAEGISARRNQDPGDQYWDTNPYKDWTESQWRQYMYGYDRLLEKVDAHVGELYNELENQGMLDNTIIIYTSDHGDGHASHQWTQKKNFYEEVINIPFIVSWKGKTKAGVVDEETLISNGLDLYPTILKLAGIDIPEYLPGENLSASFLIDAGDATPVQRDYVVSEIDQKVYKSNSPGSFNGRMVVTSKFKYFLFDNGANKEQLFDIENDPGELNPVTYDPAYHEALVSCREMLKEWITNTADDFDVDAALLTVKYDVKRCNDGLPIITQEMFTDAGAEEDGVNINGPSVIRIPDWISPEQRADPEAVYYCYFAHHDGEYIRMAWASAIEGPWHLYNVGTGVAIGDRGVLDHGQNDIQLANGIRIEQNHLASPDAHIDHENKRIILYFHAGQSTYVNDNELDAQLSYVSYSSDGLDFYDNIQPVFFGPSYFRVFRYKDDLYALTNNGTPYKALNADDPWTPPVGFNFESKLWDAHPNNPFQKAIDENTGLTSAELRVRHTGVRIVGDELQVFYSRRGDLLENIQMSTIDLSVGDWTQWEASYPPYQILQSAPGWEGGDLTPAPSETSSAPEDVNQLRDPFVFEDADGSLYLFYTGRGEDAIGVAQLIEAHNEVNSINSVKDAHLVSGISANENFGNSPVLELSEGGAPDPSKKIYLSFDLSEVQACEKALLCLYVNEGSPSDVKVYETTDVWGESEITWNNAPEKGTEIGSAWIDGTQAYFNWDISAFVKENMGGSVNLVIEAQGAGAGVLTFSSKEGANAPQLKLITNSSEYKSPPLAPTLLVASASSMSQIELNWNDNALNELGFSIERKDVNGTFVEIATLESNINTYQDMDLDAGTKYIYRVKAFNDEGASRYSNEASGFTFADDSEVLTFPVIEDSYVRGGASAAINYGTEAELRIKTGNKDDFFRNSLVKFDLTNQNLTGEDVAQASLRLYANRTELSKITASEIGDDWTETTVVWDNAPTIGNALASTSVDAANMYYEWNVTAYVQAQLNSDKIVSCLLKDVEGSGGDIRFNSKEAGTNKPELVIVTTGTIPESIFQPSLVNQGIRIYPNPASETLHVSLLKGTIRHLVVYDVIGNVMLQKDELKTDVQMDVSHLANGIYLLKIEAESGNHLLKFIKSK